MRFRAQSFISAIIVFTAFFLTAICALFFHSKKQLAVDAVERGLGPLRLAVDPVGNLLYVATWNGKSLLALDPQTGEKKKSYPLGGRGFDVQFDPETRLLYAIDYREPAVLVLRPGEGLHFYNDPDICTYPTGLAAPGPEGILIGAVSCLPIKRIDTLLPKNDWFYWKIYRLKPLNRQGLPQLRPERPINGKELLPEESLSAWRLEKDPADQDILWALSSTSNTIYRIDLNAEKTTSIPLSGQPSAPLKPSDMVLDPERGLIYVSYYFAPFISVINAKTMSQTAQWPSEQGVSDLVMISADKLAAMNRARSEVGIFNTGSGQRTRKFAVGLAPMHGIMYRNELFIACMGDDTIEVRDPETGALKRILKVR